MRTDRAADTEDAATVLARNSRPDTWIHGSVKSTLMPSSLSLSSLSTSSVASTLRAKNCFETDEPEAMGFGSIVADDKEVPLGLVVSARVVC